MKGCLLHHGSRIASSSVASHLVVNQLIARQEMAVETGNSLFTMKIVKGFV